MGSGNRYNMRVFVAFQESEKKYEYERQQAEYERQRREEIERRREEEKWIYENEIRMNQEKIALFEQRNIELIQLNEHLKRLKIEPQKLINDVAESINNVTDIVNRLKEYDKALRSSDFVLVNINKISKLIGCELKPNEKLVLQGIINDQTFQEIGDTIHLAEGTVKNIASDLYKKFKVKNKDELIKYIIENALNE